MHEHRTIVQRLNDHSLLIESLTTLVDTLAAQVDALEKKVAKQTRTTAAPEQAS